MARVIFFSIPAHGHTNPTLTLVAELVKRGEEVFYFSTNEFKERIQATGATYLAYDMPNYDSTFDSGRDLAKLYLLMVKITSEQMDALLQAVERLKPDYIIHDAICVWGKAVASVCDIPAISSISTFAFSNREMNFANTLQFYKTSGFQGIRNVLRARKIQTQLHQRYRIQPGSFIDTMMNEEGLNIVYTSKEFQPGIADFDLNQYIFIGPSISERKGDSDQTKYASFPHPFIYLSMGTIWNSTLSLDEIIRALSSAGYALVVSGVEPETENHYGETVVLRRHVNQIEVLKYCDVFISHGGMNSVSEALFHGVPLCIHPFQMEQKIVAERVADLGCGLLVETLNAEAVLKSVSKLLDDEKYRKNCEKVGLSFRQAGGVEFGVDQILNYVNKE